jgi:hypothetical protein
MLYRYAGLKQYDVSVTADLTACADIAPLSRRVVAAGHPHTDCRGIHTVLQKHRKAPSSITPFYNRTASPDWVGGAVCRLYFRQIKELHKKCDLSSTNFAALRSKTRTCDAFCLLVKYM